MKLVEVTGLFALAGIPIIKTWQLPNRYMPPREGESDDEIRADAVYRHREPSWLVKTPWGLIDIGWRKRVIEIDWSDTHVRSIITEDDVTKCDTYVHAWGMEKAHAYLKQLGVLLQATAYFPTDHDIPPELVERVLFHLKDTRATFMTNASMSQSHREYVVRGVLAVVLGTPRMAAPAT